MRRALTAVREDREYSGLPNSACDYPSVLGSTRVIRPDARRLPSRPKRSFEARPEGGFSLIELLIVVSIFIIIFAIAIPHFLSSRSNAQAAAARGDLKTIHSAELAYFSGAGQGQYGTFPQLETLNLLPSRFSDGAAMSYVRHNYTGTMTFGPSNSTFSISSVPPLISPNTPSFFVDDSGAIRYNESDIANSSSTPLGQQ